MKRKWECGVRECRRQCEVIVKSDANPPKCVWNEESHPVWILIEEPKVPESAIIKEMKIPSDGMVRNDDSKDIDFRIESPFKLEKEVENLATLYRCQHQMLLELSDKFDSHQHSLHEHKEIESSIRFLRRDMADHVHESGKSSVKNRQWGCAKLCQIKLFYSQGALTGRI